MADDCKYKSSVFWNQRKYFKNWTVDFPINHPRGIVRTWTCCIPSGKSKLILWISQFRHQKNVDLLSMLILNSYSRENILTLSQLHGCTSGILQPRVHGLFSYIGGRDRATDWTKFLSFGLYNYLPAIRVYCACMNFHCKMTYK